VTFDVESQQVAGQAKKGCSFLKKRTKKLPPLENGRSSGLQWKKFFASFFSKKKRFLKDFPLTIQAYLAGPDVFLPDALEHAKRKVAICARHGIIGRPPLNEDIDALHALPDEQAWKIIFHKDVAMMESCDIIIANLTPFRGPSADSGTLIEVGWFLGRGRPIFGYSNSAVPFADRSRRHAAAVPDPIAGLAVEGFGLPDNLMIPGAVLTGGGHPIVLPDPGPDHAFDALEIFERCVALAAATLK
jgi:nucleoside 2-deoxyribosyltransferase